jgi:hypothetical protein
VENVRGRNDLLEWRRLDAAEPDERVAHPLGLLLHLRVVGQILETAAAARGVVAARRLDAPRAGRHDLCRQGLREIALHLRHTCSDAVAGQPAPDEDDVPVQAPDPVSAVRQRLDVELDLLVSLDRCGHDEEGNRRASQPVPDRKVWCFRESETQSFTCGRNRSSPED